MRPPETRAAAIAARRATTAQALARAKGRCGRECDVLEIGMRSIISAAAFDAWGDLSDDDRSLWANRDEFVIAARRVLDHSIGPTRHTLQFSGVSAFFDQMIHHARGRK